MAKMTSGIGGLDNVFYFEKLCGPKRRSKLIETGFNFCQMLVWIR
jgi:hypothetical protein